MSLSELWNWIEEASLDLDRLLAKNNASIRKTQKKIDKLKEMME